MGIAQLVLVIWWCFFAELGHAVAPKFSSCEYRSVLMADTQGAYRLGVVHCTSDVPLHVKSTTNGAVILASHSTKEQVQAAIDGAGGAWPAGSNFAGLSQPHGQQGPKVNNYLSQWINNFKLECNLNGQTFSFLQQALFQPPTNFAFTLPPKQNAVNALWQAMGAKSPPEDLMPNTVAFAIMHDGTDDGNQVQGIMSQAQANDCIAAGALKVIIMESSSAPWRFVDSSGDPMTVNDETIVTKKVLTCDADAFETLIDARTDELFGYLETADSRDELEAAVKTYATLVNHETYAACQELLESFYTTTSKAFQFQNVRVCSTPDQQDPCCNSALRWSDCCVPTTKTVTVNGLFDAVNLQAIQAGCPPADRAAAIVLLLQTSLLNVLVAKEHPEYGCDAAAANVINIGEDEKRWEQLAGPPKDMCREIISNGKTKAAQDTCNSDSECYTDSCVSEGGGTSRCARAEGEARAEPMLKCMLDYLDADVWPFVAEKIGIDPADVNKDEQFAKTPAIWSAAVTSFKDAMGTAGCSGETGKSGWCTVDITKAECQSLSDDKAGWENSFVWIEDTNTATADDGYCRKKYNWHQASNTHVHEHLSDEAAQTGCQTIFTSMGGACTKSDGNPPHPMHTDQTACTSAGGTYSWVSFTGKTYQWHRLNPRTIWKQTNGEWSREAVAGNQQKCLLEKACNWDVHGRFTGGDETKCLQATNLQVNGQNVILPASTFEDSGSNKMACVRCWGQHCDSFEAATPPLCAIAPHEDGDCAAKSGGGPDSLSPVTAVTSEIYGDGGHYKCRRDSVAPGGGVLNTQSTCLDQRVCPLPARMEWQWENDPYVRNCEESLCYSETPSNAGECTTALGATYNGEWRTNYKGGAGLCIVYSKNDGTDMSTKTACEGESMKWWEGRLWKPGSFDTSALCDKFCENHQWPPKRECDSSSTCNARCPQCKADDRNFDGGVCIDTSKDATTCWSNTDYNWAWQAQVCFKKDFSGGASACNAMTNHEFHTCVGRAETSCKAYCYDTSLTTRATCDGQNGRYWDWELRRCIWHAHEASKATADACSGRTHAACWSEPGCQWDGSSCTGTPRACDQKANSAWVHGGATAGSQIRSSLLRCNWRRWEPCSTQATCEESGECEDWYLGDGACIVPFQSNEHGYRKGCEEITVGGATYMYADNAGCIARKMDGGSTVRVPEAECAGVGGTWRERANKRAVCEGHGSVCHNPFSDWDIYGGFGPADQTKCTDTCGHAWNFVSKWRAGVWGAANEMPLQWVQRSFASINRWETKAFDEDKYGELIENGIVRYIAEAHKQRIYCKMGTYAQWIRVVAKICGGGSFNEIVSNVAVRKVPCNALSNLNPTLSFVGKLLFVSSRCGTGSTNFKEITLQKVTAVASTLSGGGRRLLKGRRLSQCAQHEVIRSGNLLAGQTVGDALRVQGLQDTTLCLNPTVPSTEICTDNVRPDVVEVTAGTYGEPLGKTVTVDSQGYYCFSGAGDNKSYAPVLLKTTYSALLGAHRGTSLGLAALPSVLLSLMLLGRV